MILSFIITLFSLMNTLETTKNQQTKLENEALTTLKLVLKKSNKFVKAHAAEYLIWTNHAAIAKRAFLQEESKFSSEAKYRVVIWRVLAQACEDTHEQQIWIDNITKAYNDVNGLDRIHATETLAKLHQPVTDSFPTTTAEALASEDKIFATYALWASSYGSNERTQKNKEQLLKMVLNDNNITIRKISAFSLRKLKNLGITDWNTLASATLKLATDNEMYVAMLATAIITAPKIADKQMLIELENRLLKGYKSYGFYDRVELTQVLAEIGGKQHLGVLEALMNNKFAKGYFDPNSEDGADLRASAAYAIIKIFDRIKN